MVLINQFFQTTVLPGTWTVLASLYFIIVPIAFNRWSVWFSISLLMSFWSASYESLTRRSGRDTLPKDRKSEPLGLISPLIELDGADEPHGPPFCSIFDRDLPCFGEHSLSLSVYKGVGMSLIRGYGVLATSVLLCFEISTSSRLMHA